MTVPIAIVEIANAGYAIVKLPEPNNVGDYERPTEDEEI
jgi:hypothetical protein